MSLGEGESMLPLGNLCADVLHDEDSAQRAYLAGAALGDAHAHHNLAVHLEKIGDPTGAETALSGCHRGWRLLAVDALRELLDDDGPV